MSSTDIAAWWGAIVASMVLIWDFYKWRTDGAKLTMRVAPNMEIHGGNPEREGITWVVVTIANVGNRATTLKMIGVSHFNTWIDRWRNNPQRNGVFPNPSDVRPLPTMLQPGEEWVGFVPQRREDSPLNLEELSTEGHTMIWVTRSDKRGYIQRRLRIKKGADDDA